MRGYTGLIVEQEQRPKKIFIVNDDKLLLDMYCIEFRGKGFDVTPAFGGVDTMEKLRGGIVPDVILLDAESPVMDSNDILRIIREEKLVPEAKILILSNEPRTVIDENSRALGISGYIQKKSATPSQIAQEVIDIVK